jgi:hypothetical protein
MMQPIPEWWEHWTPLHRAAWEACQYNQRHKPADCVCCGCHTDDVDRAIPDDHLRVMIRDERCPAERRALARILLSRAVTG